MKYSSIAAGVLLTAVSASLAGAQARVTTPMIQRRPVASSMVLLPDGEYTITLTPATLEQRALRSAQPIELDAHIIHGTGSVTMTGSDGTVLTGAASGTHIKASGPVHASTLSVDVRGVGGTASGTFLLAGLNNHQLAGRAAIAPASRMHAHTTKSGCSGFWDCVKVITGFDWRGFGN